MFSSSATERSCASSAQESRILRFSSMLSVGSDTTSRGAAKCLPGSLMMFSMSGRLPALAMDVSFADMRMRPLVRGRHARRHPPPVGPVLRGVVGGADGGAPSPAPLWVEPNRGVVMLHYAIVFFVIALIAAVFGFTGLAAGAAGIAKILFVLF